MEGFGGHVCDFCWGPARKVKIVFPCKQELSFHGPRMSEFLRFRRLFYTRLPERIPRYVFYAVGSILVQVWAPFEHNFSSFLQPSFSCLSHRGATGFRRRPLPPHYLDEPAPCPWGGAYPVLNLSYGEPGNRTRERPSGQRPVFCLELQGMSLKPKI